MLIRIYTYIVKKVWKHINIILLGINYAYATSKNHVKVKIKFQINF